MTFNATITKTGACAAGNHIQLGITGDVTESVEIQLSDVRAEFEPGEKRRFLITALKIFAVGKTNVQLNTAALAGIDVSIE